MIDHKIRAGIIGFGDIGRKRYEILKKHSDIFQVMGIYDPYLSDSNRLVPPDLKLYESRDDIYPEVDAVFIATPHSSIAECAIEALEHGKHVFAEKPPGTTLAETQKIAAAVGGSKLKFGFNHRYHRSIMDAYEESKKLGKLIWLKGTFGKEGLSGWRADPEVSRGGILLGQGIHMLDIFTLFSPHIYTDVHAVVHRNPETGLEDNVFAILRTHSGITASLHSSSMLKSKTFEFMARYESGMIEVTGLITSEWDYGPGETETLRVYYDKTGEQRTRKYYFDDSWEREILDFANNILDNTPVGWGNRFWALDVMRIIDKIYEQGECYR